MLSDESRNGTKDAKNVSITGFSSLRGGGGGGGGGAKITSIYILSGHKRIEKRSDHAVILMLAKHLNTTLNTLG